VSDKRCACQLSVEKLTTRQREKDAAEAERRHSIFNDEARRRQSVQELTSNEAGEYVASLLGGGNITNEASESATRS
jgi:hypothetical protein